MGHCFKATKQMEKQIKDIPETAAMLIIQRLPDIEFDYDYLKACIEEAIYNAKKNNELNDWLDKSNN